MDSNFYILDSNNISNFNYDFWKFSDIKQELDTNPFGKCILYIKNNCVLGYIYYSDIYERAEINNFEVNITNRSCGIGSKLLEFLTRTVDKDITLEVNITNKIAIYLYKKYDFVEKAIRKGYYSGVDGILMKRDKKVK